MPAATPDKPGKIYVGNLPPAIEKSQLQETFSKYGDIDNVLMVVDRETGASKGFAFVTYSNPKDANDAVTAMNEKDFMGKVLKVDHALMAITRQLRGGGDRGGRGRGGPRGLLGGPPRGGFRGGPRGGRGGFPPRGGFRGHPRGRGGPPGRFNGPQGPHMMGGRDDYGEEMGMRRGGRGGHRGRGRGEPLLQQPPSLMSEDYHSARQEREDYRAPMEERGGRAPPSRDDYGMSSYGTAQSSDPYYAGREAPSDYGAASGASREYPETYGREDPYAAGRDRYGASRDPLAREPLSREPQAREPATREPLSREPRGYERDSYSRDYSAAATTRDAYAAPARDPYSAPATTERSSYEYPAAREDPYASRSAAADPRAAYEEPRREVAREYEQRPAADRGYGKEYSAYGAEPARTEDPYSRAAPERDYGGSASASRYEGYGSRDPYTRTERTDKAPYGSRDPYGSAGGPPEARTGGAGGRGYERHY